MRLKKSILIVIAAYVCLLLMPSATANAAVVTEKEPNEFKGAATECNVGDICNGELGSYTLYKQRGTTDIDWYKVHVQSPGTYRFSFPNYFSFYNGTSMMVYIYDANGRELARPDFYMERNGEEYYDFDVNTAGVIYVKFYNYFDLKTKRAHYYTFSIDSACNISGHTPVPIPGRDATCTQSGLTEGSKCSVCGVVLEGQEIIPALGHGDTEVRNKRAATYDTPGYTGDVYCTVCNQVLEKGKSIPVLKAKAQNIKVSAKASKTVKYKAKSLKKKSASFNISAKAKGTIRYKVTKCSLRYISVSRSGKVTLKKGCKKGTYKITVTAEPSRDGRYKRTSKVITVKVQ